MRVKAAEPHPAPAPCRSGVRGRRAPDAGGDLYAKRNSCISKMKFCRAAYTVCCAYAQKDRAPQGACIPKAMALPERIPTQ